MEITFLQKFAKEIHEKYPEKVDDVCFVFPSKRSGLFFKKELAKLKNGAFWAPQILTIESFIEELSGLKIIDPLEQIFQLYQVHRNAKIQPQLEFDKFIDAAKIILADFNDIDMALANAHDLFSNVKDYVELEHWDPSEADQESLTKKYLEAFQNLPKYYDAYQSQLLEAHKAYQGLVYRYLKKQIESNKLDRINRVTQQWNSIYVAGLNALTPAEKWLMDWFALEGKLQVYFEVEKQMLEDSDQESGKFIRQFIKEKKEPVKWSLDWLSDADKDIHTYAVNGNLALARTVGKLFRDNAELSKGNETAIILADENLLMPVLESLPPQIGEVNVTLGFPLGLTSFMSLAEQLFSMHKLGRNQWGTYQFYFKDVLKVISHPVLVSIYGNQSEFEKLHRALVDENKVWIDTDFIVQWISENGSFIGLKEAFTHWKKEPLKAITYLNKIIDQFQYRVEKKQVKDDVLLEQMYFFKTSIQKFEKYISQFGTQMNLDGIQRVFKQVVAPLQVPFSGEPLAGIQIMGLLETRLLSFKNIVFVSVNEGIIPSKGGFQSFLPFALRNGFGIQTHQDRESLFAYHFYRVTSQAQNIHLLYDTTTEGVGSSEKSRFIRQIEQEWPERSEKIQFSNHIGIFENEPTHINSTIEKSEQVIQNIRYYLTRKGLSPSALNNYMESPLDFYYKNVLGIQEPNVIAEDVEHNVFGTIVHACLEEFYTPFEKYVLKPEELREAFKNLDQIIHDEFIKEIPVYKSGKHYLSFHAVRNYVKRFIQLDIDFLEKHEFPVTLDKNELELNVVERIDGMDIRFKGFADRVERRNGIVHIIDYKTGSVEQRDLNVSDIEDLEVGYKPKFVQLMMYAWLTSKQLNTDTIISGIYTLRATELKLLKATVNKVSEIRTEQFELFDQFLKSKISEMLDPNVPLERNKDYTFNVF
ncbi:PD-(D/E)XK nuclease family protein [bacterium SCSIO 12643]|nr:PD-(D/E)XK nuclease family protein [bacterium SCSIO 12643]